MVKLNSKTMSDALLRLYEIPAGGDFFQQVLHLLEEHVPFAVSGYSFYDMGTRTLHKKELRTNRRERIGNLSELERLVRSHPFVDVYAANSLGPVVCMTDLMSEQEWKQTTIYNELQRPLGIAHDFSVRFYAGQQCVSYCFCNDVELDPESRRFLTMMAPHLENAYRVNRLQRRGLQGSLAENMVLLSGEGRLIDCPSAAAGLLAKYYPKEKLSFAVKLPDEVERWVAWSVADVHRQKKLAVKNADRILLLSLLRLSDGYLIVLEESVSVNPAEALRGLGLTAREAEVLVWVAQGKQNSEVGVILDISSATVRKHMEHILKKLNCETRGAAARVAMQVVNGQSPAAVPV